MKGDYSIEKSTVFMETGDIRPDTTGVTSLGQCSWSGDGRASGYITI